MFNRFLFLFLCVHSFFIFSEDFKKYNVVFKPLELINMDESYSHLRYSYPGLLLSKLQNAQFHSFSKKELSFIKQQGLRDLRHKYLLTLSDLIARHDKFIFSSDYNDSEYELLGEKIKKQRELIAKMDESSVSEPEHIIPIHFNSISVPADKLKQSGENSSPAAELIISGTIEKLDNWVYIQFRVENTILNSKELIYKSACSIEELKDKIPEISSILKTIILGRPWSVLQFNLIPKDSIVRVKDNLGLDVSEYSGFYYPGIYHVEISKPGYISKKMTVEIGENVTKVIAVQLEENKKSIISIQTFPSGADLYSGSVWLGKTPVLIDNPVIPSLLTVKLEGYNDSKYIFKSKEDRDVRMFLHSDLINYDEIIQKKRNRFYKSFSFFLLSMPLSLISYGFSSDYGYAYNRSVLYTSASSESDRLMQLSTTWYNVYLSSVFINITLFINTIFDLVDYIKSNNDL